MPCSSPETNHGEDNEEELKKAIELSLKEAEYNKNYVQPALERAAKKASISQKKV